MSLSLSRRGFAGAMLAAPIVSAVPVSSGTASLAAASLGEAARAGGILFGAAVRHDRLARDSRLRRIVLSQCRSITPEFDMNWENMEPRTGAYRLSAADQARAFARRHDLDLQGHTLLWHLGTPAWANERIARGDWRLVEHHLRVMVERYPEVLDWEVLNETIDTVEGQGGLRRNSYLQGFGPGYLARAMRTMRGLAPRARLMINDYSVEYDNPVDAARRETYLRIVRDLRQQGLVDTVGIQAHLDLAKGPLRAETIAPFFAALTDTGVRIAITELDVKEADRDAPIDVRDQRVADEVRTFLDVALDQPNTVQVTTWGLTDRDSWLQEDQFADNREGERLNRGLPFDADLVPKPMFTAMREAFQRRAQARPAG